MSSGRSAQQHAFISYVHEDRAQVDELVALLHANGIATWRDTSDLWPGEDWQSKIRQAIENDSLVFVACFSHHSSARSTTYQNAELYLAVDQLRLRRPDQPWLLPVRLSACEIPALDIGAGRTLRSLQSVDLFGEDWQAGAGRLIEGIRRIGQSLERAQQQRPMFPVGEPSPSPARERRTRVGFAAFAALALAVLLGLLIGAMVFDRWAGDDRDGSSGQEDDGAPGEPDSSSRTSTDDATSTTTSDPEVPSSTVDPSGDGPVLERLPGDDWSEEARVAFVNQCRNSPQDPPVLGPFDRDPGCDCVYDQLVGSGVTFDDFNSALAGADTSGAGFALFDAYNACSG